jgi:hypothetical protein
MKVSPAIFTLLLSTYSYTLLTSAVIMMASLCRLVDVIMTNIFRNIFFLFPSFPLSSSLFLSRFKKKAPTGYDVIADDGNGDDFFITPKGLPF